MKENMMEKNVVEHECRKNSHNNKENNDVVKLSAVRHLPAHKKD